MSDRPILVVLESDQSALAPEAPELIALAGEMAEAVDTVVVAAVFASPGVDLDHLRGPRLTAIHSLWHPLLESGDHEAHARAIFSTYEQIEPRAVIFHHSPVGRVAGPWLAVQINAPFFSNCAHLAIAGDSFDVERLTYDEAVVERVNVAASSIVVTATPSRVAVVGSAYQPPRLTKSDGNLDGFRPRVRTIATSHADGPSLRSAKTIVAAGAGVQSAEDFHALERLSKQLGGTIAGSKPIVDRGWISASRKVGLTGTTVTPDLYLAVGISGASQHMAGCSRAKTIVAINTDRRAPIFRYARYGVIGDSGVIARALLEAMFVSADELGDQA